MVCHACHLSPGDADQALLDKEGINNFIPMRYEVRIRNGAQEA